MGLDQIPKSLHRRYTFEERDHAVAILAQDFPEQFKDILDCLSAFTLRKSYITVPGGARSPIPEVIDGFLSGLKPVKEKKRKKSFAKVERLPVPPIGPIEGRGWQPRQFNIHTEVDGQGKAYDSFITSPAPMSKLFDAMMDTAAETDFWLKLATNMGLSEKEAHNAFILSRNILPKDAE